MEWKVAAGIARGPDHERRDEPCQDAFAFQRDGQWLAAVVCDGAGSAAQSELGARHAATVVSRHLLQAASGFTGEDFLGFWRQHIKSGIAYARETLPAADKDLSAFHATIVGVIANAEQALIFHIGDGVAAASNNGEWANCVLSLPENGEFANETFFYTQDTWHRHLRYTLAPEAGEFILMSDGTASFALSRDRKGLDEGFVRPVTHYLKQAEEAQGSQALSGTLNQEQPRRISGDDKTLLWAARLPAPTQ
ncbi:hypothetical protein CAI21_22075 [Alkalilimnicola ehrlichii]|uniref:PPM-type phosphatase domain-containing protein n=1 Tax=Alkalilimnicola ehrlichii TaxID=351052 RepID=A0A3E0WFQ9_9GAMM|nr:PP2C family serine/threonine-protein phosphatase [Alkalilimnicola ehrlichii]RFA24340.1 hypothetical protein CAI21_22075 [Alkalilimnicola ehrlichii]RFA31568.1 hypothetical protein CAL65_22255 [Alkalilimnicola ehrlichii]